MAKRKSSSVSSFFLVLLTLGLISLLVFSVSSVRRFQEIKSSKAATLPAFPGAEGFGAKSVGGRGGRVIEVTNLNISGGGSLRAALEASGPRIVVFRIGGVIRLHDDLKITNPFITVAGQTAPGNGIVLRGGGIRIGTHDVIIRGLHIRPGDDSDGSTTTTRDAVNISNSGSGNEVYNVIVDHNSFSWALDENTSVYNSGPGSHDITYSWNIISEALDRSIHIDEGKTSPDRHSMGMLLSSKPGESAPRNISIHHNFFAHNNDRHPLSQATNVEFVNNLVYNWGSGPTKIDSETGAAINFNIIGNHYISGRNTRGQLPKSLPVWIDASVPSGSRIFVRDNIGPRNSGGSGDDAWKNVYCEGSCRRSDSSGFASTIANPVPSSGVKSMILQYAGATTRRDRIDSLMVEDARNGTGSIIDCVTNCDTGDVRARRGWSVYSTSTSAPSDSDHDGMPNSWETNRGLNPNNSGDSSRLAPSGYTYVEEYINSLISLPSYLQPTPIPTVLTPTTTPASSVRTFSRRIWASAGDVEQRLSDGYMTMESTDLEMVTESGTGNEQAIGLRFGSIQVPNRAQITNAYIEFTVDETSSVDTSLHIMGQAADNPPAFTKTNWNLSDGVRPRTSASVAWDKIPAWNSVGATVKSPNISTIIQELVNRSGWRSGNAMVFIIKGSGKRVAKSYNGSSTRAPRLVIEYR